MNKRALVFVVMLAASIAAACGSALPAECSDSTSPHVRFFLDAGQSFWFSDELGVVQVNWDGQALKNYYPDGSTSVWYELEDTRILTEGGPTLARCGRVFVIVLSEGDKFFMEEPSE